MEATPQNNAPVYVGIDLSKDRLDLHVLPSGEAWSQANDVEALASLASQLTTFSPALVVMEATGGLERPVAAELAARVAGRRDQVRCRTNRRANWRRFSPVAANYWECEPLKATDATRRRLRCDGASTRI